MENPRNGPETSKVDEHKEEAEGLDEKKYDVGSTERSDGDDGPESDEGRPQSEQIEQTEPPEEPASSDVGSTKSEDFFDMRFAKNFGITPEQLQEIEGFERLSPPQQKLIYDNFLQCTLGGVREEAARLCQETNMEKREALVSITGKFLGQAAAGLRETLTGVHHSLKAEKEVLDRAFKGGFEEHREILGQLVQSVANYGPRVHQNIDGELEVDLVNIRERATDKETRDAEWFAMSELNRVAHEFAKIPSAWRGKTLGVDDGSVENSRAGTFFREKIMRQKTESKARERSSTYASAEQRFIKAKKVLEGVMRKGGKTDLDISETLIGIDSRVNQLQTLQTNPDAFDELDNIENKNLYLETAKGLMTKSGLGYLSLGFAGRTVAGATFGFVATPVVSAGIASIRSWDRTAAELRERDRNARRGVSDAKEGSLNIVDSESLVNKIDMLMEKYRDAEAEKNEAEKDGTETGEEIMKRYNKILKLLSSLSARVDYVHDKMMLNRINYGPKSTAVTEQTRLAEVLGEALAVLKQSELSEMYSERGDVLKERLGKNLERTEQNIIDSRKLYRKENRRRSIEKAAALSLAGAFIADLYQSKFGSNIEGSVSEPTSEPETPPSDAEVPEEAAAAAATEAVPSTSEVETSDDGSEAPAEEETPVAEEKGPTSEPETPPSDAEVPEEAAATAATEAVPSTSEVETSDDGSEAPAEEETPVAEEKGPTHVQSEIIAAEYHIQKGDTLTDIIKEQIPDIKNLATEQGQDNAIANILNSLTSEELDLIGIRSGDVDLIYAGESLNMEELNKIIGERQNFLDKAASRFGGYVEEEVSVTENVSSAEVDSQTAPEDADASAETVADEAASTDSENIAAHDESTYLDDASPTETESSETTSEVTENISSSESPYGVESAEIIKFREQETKAFLDYSEKLYNHRVQRIQNGNLSLSASHNNAATAQLRSVFDSYVLSMTSETPSLSSEKGRVLLEGNITATDRVRAAEYLTEQVKNDKTKYGNALNRIIKDILRNKAYAPILEAATTSSETAEVLEDIPVAETTEPAKNFANFENTKVPAKVLEYLKQEEISPMEWSLIKDMSMANIISASEESASTELKEIAEKILSINGTKTFSDGVGTGRWEGAIDIDPVMSAEEFVEQNISAYKLKNFVLRGNK